MNGNFWPGLKRDNTCDQRQNKMLSWACNMYMKRKSSYPAKVECMRCTLLTQAAFYRINIWHYRCKVVHGVLYSKIRHKESIPRSKLLSIPKSPMPQLYNCSLKKSYTIYGWCFLTWTNFSFYSCPSHPIQPPKLEGSIAPFFSSKSKYELRLFTMIPCILWNIEHF